MTYEMEKYHEGIIDTPSYGVYLGHGRLLGVLLLEV